MSATSTGANLSLAGLDVAGNLRLTAATSVEATGALVIGGTTDIAAQNGTHLREGEQRAASFAECVIRHFSIRIDN